MYSVVYKNNSIELPNYNFAIATALENAEAMNNGNSSFKEKCKTLYNAMASFIDIENIIGKFDNEIDPNEIQILFSKICNAYNQPIVDERMKQFEESIENQSLDKIQGFVDSITTVKDLKK